MGDSLGNALKNAQQDQAEDGLDTTQPQGTEIQSIEQQLMGDSAPEATQEADQELSDPTNPKPFTPNEVEESNEESEKVEKELEEIEEKGKEQLAEEKKALDEKQEQEKGEIEEKLDKTSEKDKVSVMDRILTNVYEKLEIAQTENLDYKIRNKILQEQLEKVTIELNRVKLDDTKISLSEDSRRFYKLESRYNAKPDDTALERRYVERLLEKIEDITGKDMRNKVINDLYKQKTDIGKLSENPGSVKSPMKKAQQTPGWSGYTVENF